jgi:hypothetical protein
MDIQQPNLAGLDTSKARWYQDAYRALKTPNFAVTKSTNQGYSSGSWTDITFDTVHHNNLNLWDTANNRVSSQGVPGMYFLTAQVTCYFTTFAPTVSTPVILAIRTPSNVVRASFVHEIIAGVSYTTANYLFTLSVSCLDYLTGLRGTGENDYRILSLWNGTGFPVRIAGTDSSDNPPRFQGFKIPF